ncbi:hypothetical protein QFC21_005496 [Naganishia friedmannii]|uniref:Uncharacterized protein n=1 Tax=Naganishia friedmannii TaxID=89922 RepID=A0ACC2V9P4_9TREE|nr:hypothetical protein QFC21_005496 [Naganishia friedmannii]
MPYQAGKHGGTTFTSVSSAFVSGSFASHDAMTIGAPTMVPAPPNQTHMMNNGGAGHAGQNAINGGNMDIVMGAPTNALAALTASLANPQTLFEMCSDIRRKLRKVQGYEKFLEMPPTAQRLDVVTHVWLSFKLGSSLCHLFNMLLPTLNPHPPAPIPVEFPDFDYPEGNGVFTWALLPQNVKSCKKGAAKFIVKMTELRKEGKWPQEDPLWAVHELLGDDTSGLMKVLRTTSLLLERLPESAWIREDDSPGTPFGNSVPVLADENGGYVGEANDALANMTITSTNPNGMAAHARSASNTVGLAANAARSMSISNGFTSTLTNSNKNGRLPGGLTINTTLENHNHTMARSASGTHPHQSFPAGPLTGIDLGPVGVGGAAMHVWEILKTEKKYVAELEILQTYSQSLLQHSIVAPDTVHTIFANIAKLVNFSRRFLTALETEYEPMVEKGGASWIEGRWGYPFVTYELDFEVYEPYCANYMAAINLVEKETPNLTKLSETVASTDYAYKQELSAGLDVAKRIAEKVNETLRQATNVTIVQELESRVKDWKGHHINDFGKLLLDGQFMVTKADMDRDYEVYLFEKMILCCKEVIPDKKDKKNGKSGSLLKKDRSSQSMAPKKNLLNLKGRIYVNNLTHIQDVGIEGMYIHFDPVAVATDTPWFHFAGGYALAVYWRQQDNPNEYENFVLHLKNSEQFAKWQSEITKLMKADQERREQRHREAISKDRQARASAASRMQYVSQFPMTPSSEQVMQSAASSGFFTEDDARRVQDPAWQEENASPGAGYSSPPYNANGSRRTHSQQGIPRPSDRYSQNSVRSTSGDHHNVMAQWRSQAGGPPMPPMARKMSELSVVTEASFGNNHQSMHRNKFSLGKMAAYGEEFTSSGLATTPEVDSGQDIPSSSTTRGVNGPGAGMQRNTSTHYPHPSVPHPQLLSSARSRSASSPHVMQSAKVTDAFYPPSQFSPAITPPIAHLNGSWNSGTGPTYPIPEGNIAVFNPSKISLAATEFDPKRSSSSSFSSQPSEDSRPPDTPYSGHVAELRGGDSGESLQAFSQMVIVKVHSHKGVFKLAVPADIDCDDLKSRVSRKVQMCAGGVTGSQVKCYYRDEEREKLRLDDDDDLNTLFEPVIRGITREVELEVKV